MAKSVNIHQSRLDQQIYGSLVRHPHSSCLQCELPIKKTADVRCNIKCISCRARFHLHCFLRNHRVSLLRQECIRCVTMTELDDIHMFRDFAYFQ